MAANLKTIEYSFLQSPSGTTYATGVKFTSDPIQIVVSETNTRIFQNVTLEVAFSDNSTTASTPTSSVLGIQLQGSAETTHTSTNNMTNTGENHSYILTMDCTQHFQQKFGWKTPNKSCQFSAQITGTNLITSNYAAKLYITYQYDEDFTNPSMNPSAEYKDNRVKTVRIPLESGTGALTTSLTEIGTNQVPALDTFLPESGKVYHDIWFQVEGNEHTTVLSQNYTDYRLSLALDSEAASNDAVHEASLISSRWFRRIWKRKDMATNVVHAFKMATTHISGATFNHLSVILYVTYSYEIDTTTTTMISLAMPFVIAPGGLYGSGLVTTEPSIGYINFRLPESSVTLSQSGVLIHYVQDNSGTTSVKAGSQSSYRAYTDLALTYCGEVCLSQRVDSGSQYGAGISIAQGDNTFTISMYSGGLTAGRPSAISGILYLNYTTAIDVRGEDYHPHTIIQGAIYKEVSTAYIYHKNDDFKTLIPQSYYFITQAGVSLSAVSIGIGGTSLITGGNVAMKRRGDEYPGVGYLTLLSMWGQGMLEGGVYTYISDITDKIYRFPGDPGIGRINTQVSHVLESIWNRTNTSVLMYYTYYPNSWNYNGQVIGYSGDGSGITVDIYTVTTRDWVGSVITKVGGYYTFKWGCSVCQLYAVARQSSSQVGRSDDGAAQP